MDRIKFQNYKAFDEGEIEIRPLTLLLGANSSGKSSILHLFLMLEQTISNAEEYHAALKANGHCISLGEDENLLKDRDHNKTLNLEFGINAIEFINNVKSLQEEKRIVAYISFMHSLREIDPKKYKDYTEKLTEHIQFQNPKDKLQPYNFQKFFEPDNFGLLYNLFYNSSNQNDNNSWWSKKLDIETQEKLISSLLRCYDAFTSAFNPYPDKASIKFILTYNEGLKKLKVTECHVLVGETALIQILNQGKQSFVSSDIFDKEDLDLLANYSKFNIEFDGLSVRSVSDINSPFTNYLVLLIEQAFKSVQDFFSKKNMSYVGPLRANPQRYYFLDDSNSNVTLDHKNGASLAEILKKDGKIREKINKWLERFDLNVDVTEFQDIIHNIKVTQNQLLLDIPDVGFGISQVLPILVEGMMAPSKSTIIMEQPEIHLHPMMQAELADLFIDILQLQTKSKSRIRKHLIIETHSEYILKRIRRRMAEGLISPKHVAIYFVKPRNKENPETAEINLAPISKDGTIEWPRDFYITEIEDEMAFFKSKITKS